MTDAFAIKIQHAQLAYGHITEPVLQDLSLSFPANQWTCLLGRSGCGKTSVLRKLAGLLEDAHWHGEILTSDGQPLAGRIAYMAQQDLLLPWLSVLDNVCVGYRLKGKPVTQVIRDQALRLLEQVGMSENAQALPQTLSGGMRQRVALARTLMQDQPVVLMDEPFSALDAVTRHKLQTLSFELLQHKTVVLVTHDPQEAVRLGHQLYVFEGNPARARSLPTLSTQPPRQLDSDTAQLQEQILKRLEVDHA
ncbi:ABC transporter ATP-binding protein [Marinomonas atlantica]|uniref:ABC transporter ATP-binding protein n=1 Tax=Marinomonas atlantica TaxID=1806668 RepID=UPI000836DB88|nr:ABC transporter ATP-binding protein [Marinomonas atlantica]MCO4785066.1 ABC transporter ATP-binding protein [Marinomonas atlantica]